VDRKRAVYGGRGGSPTRWVHLLQLDFAYVRLSDPGGAGNSRGHTRETRGRAFRNGWKATRVTSNPLVAQGNRSRRQETTRRVDTASPSRSASTAREVRLSPQPRRSDFPTSTDELLLSLAANHAAAAFQSARLVQERKTGRRSAPQGSQRARGEGGRGEQPSCIWPMRSSARCVVSRRSWRRACSPRRSFFRRVQRGRSTLRRGYGGGRSGFEHDAPALVIVGLRPSIPGIPIGTRSKLDDVLASAAVYRSGRSARVDARDWASARGPLFRSRTPPGPRLDGCEPHRRRRPSVGHGQRFVQ